MTAKKMKVTNFEYGLAMPVEIKMKHIDYNPDAADNDQLEMARIFLERHLSNPSYVTREVQKIRTFGSQREKNPVKAANIYYANNGPQELARELVIQSRIHTEGKNVFEFPQAVKLFDRTEFRHAYASTISKALETKLV